jgi:non-homologous end joining protein Ku
MKGKEIALAPEQEPRHADVVDLMERLRRSLAQSGGTAGSSRRAARPKRTAGTTTPKKRARRAA